MADSILGGLINPNLEKILKLFLHNKDKLFHLNTISSNSNVPLATTFRIVKKLVKLNIIKTINIGKLKIYKLNINKKTETLNALLR